MFKQTETLTQGEAERHFQEIEDDKPRAEGHLETDGHR